MPPIYTVPALADLNSLPNAAQTVAHVLEALRQHGWQLVGGPASGCWLIEDVEHRSSATVAIAPLTGLWHVSEVRTALRAPSLSPGDQLRALADELDRQAKAS